MFVTMISAPIKIMKKEKNSISKLKECEFIKDINNEERLCLVGYCYERLYLIVSTGMLK